MTGRLILWRLDRLSEREALSRHMPEKKYQDFAYADEAHQGLLQQVMAGPFRLRQTQKQIFFFRNSDINPATLEVCSRTIKSSDYRLCEIAGTTYLIAGVIASKIKPRALASKTSISLANISTSFLRQTACWPPTGKWAAMKLSGREASQSQITLSGREQSPQLIACLYEYLHPFQFKSNHRQTTSQQKLNYII